MSDPLVREIVLRVLRELEAGGASDCGCADARACSCAGSGVPAAGAAAPGRATVPATWPPHRVAIGCDHGGVEMKEDLATWLRHRKFRVVDCGTHGSGSVDYPDFAAAVARQVAEGRCEAGIVIDGAGIGSAMAANKVNGVRCANCHDIATIKNSRRHNDANVLSLGSGVVPATLARRMVSVWLETPHDGGRHLGRVRKIVELERGT